jgi:hypothetical protein
MRGGEVMVQPSYPFARLWDDAAARLDPGGEPVSTAPGRSRKRRAVRQGQCSPAPLHTIFVLCEAAGPPSVVPLSLRDAVVELARHIFRIDPSDPGRLQREMDTLTTIARRVQVAQLVYPRRFDGLDAVSQLVRKTLNR